MEAFWPQQPSYRQLDSEITHRDGDTRTLTEDELERQIRVGWDIWCDA